MTKLYLTAILMSVILVTVACGGGGNTYIGDTHVGKYTTVTLEESLTTPDVAAVVELIDPIEGAELYINDVKVADFDSYGIAEFEPDEFGDVECKIVADGETYIDTLAMYIETGFIRYNSNGANGDFKLPVEGGEVVLTPSSVTFGSSDMIWAYNVRVPKDKTITFDYISTILPDSNPHYGNNKLDIHFRLDDYADRYLLYPDEMYPAKYIDAETDKWISAPMELSHGIHTVFVCPNFRSDKNYISVIHASDFSSGTFSANYKSLDTWPSD